MRFKVTISYDGSNFNGFQKQNNYRSVEQEINDVLTKMHKHEVKIVGAGRTDKDVHAFGQVFHFETDKKIPCKNLKKAMNEMLPLSIQIKGCSIVKDDFHARYSAHKKVYVYKIKNTDVKNVFENRYYAYIKENIDINLLNEACKLFIGKHNFKNFTTNKIEEVESFDKTIYDVNVKESKNKIEITFYGSGFLRYQVRMMVGALIVVSTKRKPIEFISKLLKDNVDEKCSYKADPQGLYLKKVIY